MVRAGGSERGVALILVMTVVLALTLIATPFVISMLLQERLGTTARYESQAGYGAEGTRNYAIWRLMSSVDQQERRFNAGPLATYHYDPALEFDIRLDDPYLRDKVKVQDSLDKIWGVHVQDEQGKLNVLTAPQGAVARVEALVDPRIANRKDFLTQYSGRDYGWCFPQRIRTVNGAGNPLAGGAGQGVGVDQAYPYGNRSRVRLSKPGLKPLYATVSDNRGASLVLDQNVDTAFVDGMIEVEARHPVNLNTARLETLVAIFQGLNFPGVPNSQVDAAAATEIARAVVDKDFTRMEDFILALAVMGNVDPRQRAVVGLNAICPTASPLQGSGTVGLCFKSYDVHTVEAAASMNNPAGAQVAGRGFREVVSVSPPAILMRYAESQLDFDLMRALGAALQDRRINGYPFGNRSVSFPNFMPLPPTPPQPTMAYAPSDLALKPQQRGGPGGNEAYVQPAPADDFRGEGDYDNELVQQAGGRWWDQQPRETFSDSQEGKRLQQNATLSYPWNHVLTYLKNSGAPAASDLTVGGFEMWFKADTVAAPQPLLDIRENDWYNRLTLRIENNELIVTACDGTLGTPGAQGAALIDNGCAEVRMPLPMANDAWQHVSAGWKGTRLGELALFADGFAHPQQKFRHWNPEGLEMITTLTGPLSDTATSWALQNNGWIPTNITVGIINHPVALRVGNECVLSDGGTLIRGARGTQAVQHPAGAKVTLWGYVSRLTSQPVSVQFNPNFTDQLPYDRLTTGGGTLQYQIGVNPQAVVAGDKQDPNNPAIRYVDPTQTDIGVTTANITDFPDQGYIRIQQEVIFYTGRSTGGVGGQGNAKFSGCARGQLGTMAAQHNTGQQVQLWGFPVSSTANYLQKTIVQIDDEWFLVQKNLDTTRPNFWISFLDSSSGTPVPVPLYRGMQVLGSIPNSHAAGAQVIPTFAVQGENMGPGDPVTMTDASNNKELHQVRRTPMQVQGQGGPNINLGNRQVVGLLANVVRDYAADGLFVRVLKFPSGELIGLPWLMSSNPNVNVGPVDGLVDEVKFFASQRSGLRVGREVTTTDVSVQLNADPTQIWGGYPTRGGLYKIGDEVIGWGNLTLDTVSQAKRAWLNSTAEVHDVGDPVFDLSWMPVSTLAADVSMTERVVRLNQKLCGRERHRQGRAYSRGYVLIGTELLGFEWNNGDGLQLIMPPRFDGTTGLYRGAFGTSPGFHPANGSLVYGVPFRYWDTYKPREFDNTMVYFQWSTRMDLAQWRNLQWVQEIPANDPNIIVHAFVRIDGKGEFWDPPGFTETSLVQEFLVPDGKNPIHKIGHRNDAGQFDVRFVVEYKPGSYDSLAPAAAVSWKRAPKIKEVRVEYDRPTQTFYHEDQ